MQGGFHNGVEVAKAVLRMVAMVVGEMNLEIKGIDGKLMHDHT